MSSQQARSRTRAATLGADQIAYFDGIAWHALGSSGGKGPFIGNGLALATSNQKLYLGGNFTSAGGDTQARGIASTSLAARAPVK